jgi:hypothetical protein
MGGIVRTPTARVNRGSVRRVAETAAEARKSGPFQRNIAKMAADWENLPGRFEAAGMTRSSPKPESAQPTPQRVPGF